MKKSAKLYRVLTSLMAIVCLAILSGCSDEPEPDINLTVNDISRGRWNVEYFYPEDMSVHPLVEIQFFDDYRYYYYLKQDKTLHGGIYSLEGNSIILREYVEDEESDKISTIEVKRVEKKYLKLVYDGVTYECEPYGLSLRPTITYEDYDTFTANGVPYNFMTFTHGGFVHVGMCRVTDSLVNLEVRGIYGGHETGLEHDIVNYDSEITLNLNIDIHDYETAVWGTLLNPRKDYDADNVPLTYKVALPGQDPYEDSFKYNTYGYRISDTDQGKIVYVDKWNHGRGDEIRLVLRFKNVSFSRIDDNDSIPEKIVISGYVTFTIIDKRN